MVTAMVDATSNRKSIEAVTANLERNQKLHSSLAISVMLAICHLRKRAVHSLGINSTIGRRLKLSGDLPILQ